MDFEVVIEGFAGVVHCEGVCKIHIGRVAVEIGSSQWTMKGPGGILTGKVAFDILY